MAKPLQVRVSDDIREWLDQRAGLTMATSADLQTRSELVMWRTVLEAELRRIRLTVAQASCLADIFNGTVLNMSLGKIMWMEAADAFAIARDTPVPHLSSYAEKWGVDEERLLNWLAGLSDTADHALREAFARWWQLDDASPSVESFAKVGLTVIADDALPAHEEAQS